MIINEENVFDCFSRSLEQANRLRPYKNSGMLKPYLGFNLVQFNDGEVTDVYISVCYENGHSHGPLVPFDRKEICEYLTSLTQKERAIVLNKTLDRLFPKWKEKPGLHWVLDEN